MKSNEAHNVTVVEKLRYSRLLANHCSRMSQKQVENAFEEFESLCGRTALLAPSCGTLLIAKQFFSNKKKNGCSALLLHEVWRDPHYTSTLQLLFSKHSIYMSRIVVYF